MSQQSFAKVFFPRDDGSVKVEETLARYSATDLEGSPGHLLREMRARGGRLPWVSKGARNTAALAVQSLALPPRTRQALQRWIAGAPYLSPPKTSLFIWVNFVSPLGPRWCGGVNGCRPVWTLTSPNPVKQVQTILSHVKSGSQALPSATAADRSAFVKTARQHLSGPELEAAVDYAKQAAYLSTGA